jgi:hypothetical protein
VTVGPVSPPRCLPWVASLGARLAWVAFRVAKATVVLARSPTLSGAQLLAYLAGERMRAMAVAALVFDDLANQLGLDILGAVGAVPDFRGELNSGRRSRPGGLGRDLPASRLLVVLGLRLGDVAEQRFLLTPAAGSMTRRTGGGASAEGVADPPVAAADAARFMFHLEDLGARKETSSCARVAPGDSSSGRASSRHSTTDPGSGRRSRGGNRPRDRTWWVTSNSAVAESLDFATVPSPHGRSPAAGAEVLSHSGPVDLGMRRESSLSR